MTRLGFELYQFRPVLRVKSRYEETAQGEPVSVSFGTDESIYAKETSDA